MNLNSFAAAWSPRVLSILRIVVALVILQYGLAKTFGFPAVPGFANLTPTSLAGIAGLIELSGALLLIGFLTRPTAFVLSGLMAFAYFLGHAPNGTFPILNRGDLSVVLCFLFLYISIAGPGPWSVDAMRGNATQGSRALSP
jgi:putative oxidoreductase